MTTTIKLGKDYRLKVGDGSSTEVFNIVGGEGTLSFKGASDKIDTSSKDDGQYKSMAFGQTEISLDLSGILKLPDTGLAALDTAFKSGVPIDIQIVYQSTTTKFSGSVYVGNRSVDLTNNQAAKYSFTLALNGAPTLDSLFS